MTPCSTCGTDYTAEPCLECAAELQTVQRVEATVYPTSIYDAAFWDEKCNLVI